MGRLDLQSALLLSLLQAFFRLAIELHNFVEQFPTLRTDFRTTTAMLGRRPDPGFGILFAKRIEFCFYVRKLVQQFLLDCEQPYQRTHIGTFRKLQLALRQVAQLRQHAMFLVDKLCQEFGFQVRTRC